MAPTRPFPGSSRVVPTLARFVTAQSPPRAVVIDGNPTRGSQLAGFLGLWATSGPGDHRRSGLPGRRRDRRRRARPGQLRPDPRCLGLDRHPDQPQERRADRELPVYVYGPLDLEIKPAQPALDFPAVKFLVQPVDAATSREAARRQAVEAFTDAERAGYAREAATLLARIAAAAPQSPGRRT